MKPAISVFCFLPTGCSNAVRGAIVPTGASPRPVPTLDLAQLEAALHHYVDNSVAAATKLSYATAQRRYLSFCAAAGVTQPFPATENVLCRYVTYLGQQNLKHKTIKAYLSGLRFTQIHLGGGNPFQNDAMPQLEYVLKGIKRVQARQAEPPSQRLPITGDIMRSLHTVWISECPDPDNVMLWAAACVGFFGFLREGEFTSPSANAFDPEVHLCLSDIALDSHTSPTMVRLRIKQSKTDPFRLGVDVFLGSTGAIICPIQAIIQYIAVCSPNPGPLFVTQDGSPLTRAMLVTRLHTALQQAGIPSGQYSGHSFRIGAATTAAKSGMEDSLIQTLGRWKSEAYKIYIRIPRQELAAASASLLSRK